MLQKLRQIAESAGRETLRFYGQPLTVDAKADDSPLTQADLASHRLILRELAATFPDIPIVSEEDESISDRFDPDGTWFVVDPLDGTKDFIKQTDCFTVNIGLIKDRQPVAGVVHVPASGVTYAADTDGAWRASPNEPPTSIAVSPAADPLRIVASRDHAGPEVKALLERFPDAECLSIGSSLKFCLVAEGKADIYLRDVPTMEWDTAAAQAIVQAAGGAVLTHPAQKALTYGKSEFRNESLLTIGDRELLKQLRVERF
ncbi:MAG: 3'(2'),5'-bisphosphate nucleotidase CysQ [Synoicihabitans sp.]